MLEYLPWSLKSIDESIKSYKEGRFSILDVELGGQCNYHCIYCDSPNREKKCLVSEERLEMAFSEGNIRWVFICGLGEPTVKENRRVLFALLQLCEKYGAKCSIFTNLSYLGPDLLSYIDKGILHLLFKYDSRDSVKNMGLYGVSDANRQIYNIERIKKHVIVHNGCTNIAASIVPTKENANDIINIVKDCIENNIYPLIAELENSGDAQDYYAQLSLSDEELLEIKKKVNALIGETYIVPICPAVISGIHIRNDGCVTVDEMTGLSCHWFWLEEPKTKVIENFNEADYKDITDGIEMFRKERFSFVQSLLCDSKNKVFGGCGGDVSSLLKKYISSKEES